MLHLIRTEVFSYWEKIKQNPLYFLAGLLSLWLILPFSFWLLRGEAVKNLDSLIQELNQRQDDIKQATLLLEQYRTNQQIALTQNQKESLYRLIQDEESSFRSFFFLMFTKIPLFLFFLLLGILLERHFHWSARFEKSAPVRSSKIKIYAPTPNPGTTPPTTTPAPPTQPPAGTDSPEPSAPDPITKNA